MPEKIINFFKSKKIKRLEGLLLESQYEACALEDDLRRANLNIKKLKKLIKENQCQIQPQN